MTISNLINVLIVVAHELAPAPHELMTPQPRMHQADLNYGHFAQAVLNAETQSLKHSLIRHRSGNSRFAAHRRLNRTRTLSSEPPKRRRRASCAWPQSMLTFFWLAAVKTPQDTTFILWTLHFYYIYTTVSTFILWILHLYVGYYTHHHHDHRHHHLHLH